MEFRQHCSSFNDGRPCDPQCDQPYIPLADPWRNVAAPGGLHTDSGDNHGFADAILHPMGGEWYRLHFGWGGDVVAGDTLALSPPEFAKCGTQRTGWVCGWDATRGDMPPQDYQLPGSLPSTSEGVVDRIACFNQGVNGNFCVDPIRVSAVNCGGVFLFRLPDVPSGTEGYCFDEIGGVGSCPPGTFDHDMLPETPCVAAGGR